MNVPAKKENDTFSLEPKNFNDLMKFAEMIAASDLAPKDYKNKPGNCVIAMQMGHEIGLKAMQAIQNIAVINGRPSVWGDAAKAIVQASPLCEDIIETFDEATMTATCVAKRVGQEPHVSTFSKKDAEVAKLWSKPGPWQQYPKRMLQLRARGFALRDKFADILKGLHFAEEAMDTIVIDSDTGKPKQKVSGERFTQLFGRVQNQDPPADIVNAEIKADEPGTTVPVKKNIEEYLADKPGTTVPAKKTLKDHKKWWDIEEYFDLYPEDLKRFKKESIADLAKVDINHFDFIWKKLMEERT